MAALTLPRLIRNTSAVIYAKCLFGAIFAATLEANREYAKGGSQAEAGASLNARTHPQPSTRMVPLAVWPTLPMPLFVGDINNIPEMNRIL